MKIDSLGKSKKQKALTEYEFKLPVLQRGLDIAVENYQTSTDLSLRRRVQLNDYMLSLLVEGSQAVHTGIDRLTVDNSSILIFCPCNFLMCEKRTSIRGQYQSIVVYFSRQQLLDFFVRHQFSNKLNTPDAAVRAVQKDAFIESFISSFIALMQVTPGVPQELASHKLEELLMYLAIKDPVTTDWLYANCIKTDADFEFKRLIESNVDATISLDELAFLANMSPATFRRKFIKSFGMAPTKWFLQQRMNLAKNLLEDPGNKPGSVYYRVGYENHSSFAHSFKKLFGETPTEYQRRILS